MGGWMWSPGLVCSLVLAASVAASVPAAERVAAAKHEHARALAALLEQHQQQAQRGPAAAPPPYQGLAPPPAYQPGADFVAPDDFPEVYDKYENRLERFVRVQWDEKPELGLGTVVDVMAGNASTVEVVFDKGIADIRGLLSSTTKELKSMLDSAVKGEISLGVAHSVPAKELSALLEVEVDASAGLPDVSVQDDGAFEYNPFVGAAEVQYSIHGFGRVKSSELGIEWQPVLYEEAPDSEPPYAALEMPKQLPSFELPPDSVLKLRGDQAVRPVLAMARKGDSEEFVPLQDLRGVPDPAASSGVVFGMISDEIGDRRAAFAARQAGNAEATREEVDAARQAARQEHRDAMNPTCMGCTTSQCRTTCAMVKFAGPPTCAIGGLLCCVLACGR